MTDLEKLLKRMDEIIEFRAHSKGVDLYDREGHFAKHIDPAPLAPEFYALRDDIKKMIEEAK